MFLRASRSPNPALTCCVKYLGLRWSNCFRRTVGYMISVQQIPFIIDQLYFL